MANDDLSKISKALSDQLKPLHGEIARIHREMSDLNLSYLRTSTELHKIGRDIARVDSELEGIKETLDQHTEKLDGQSAALIEIESTLKGYSDMYKINKSDIDKIKKHIGLPATTG